MKKFFVLVAFAGITGAAFADYYRGGSCSSGYYGQGQSGSYQQPQGGMQYRGGYRQNGYYQEPSSDMQSDQKAMYQNMQVRTENDKQVYKRLKDALSRYENVNISVNNGDVTLRGFVNSQSDRRAIEEKIQGLDGVRNITNNIKVKGENGTGGFGNWNRDSRNLRDSWDHDMNRNNNNNNY